MSYRILLLLLLGTHWPVWQWYFQRASDGSDEPWGLLALASVFLFVPWSRMKKHVPEWLLVAALTFEIFFALFADSWLPLPRALSLVSLLGLILLNLGAPAGVTGLLCLSLPWIATLQFYLGYPLRVVTGEVTRWMLNACGLDVLREGIVLIWHNQQVVIDRPCAGIYMLWFGGFITYLMASYFRLTFRQCLSLGITSFLLILTANVLRNFVLFFLETGLLPLPDVAHEWVGVGLFLLAITFLAKITETRVPGRALRSAD